MTKSNFSKVEKSLDVALRKLLVDNLSELATISGAIQDGHAKENSKEMEAVIVKFQKELQRIKKDDANLFSKLNLSLEDIQRIESPYQEYTQEDWLRLRNLKLRIDELKKELSGHTSLDKENDQQVANERQLHINKRHNVRKGWLPS